MKNGRKPQMNQPDVPPPTTSTDDTRPPAHATFPAAPDSPEAAERTLTDSLVTGLLYGLSLPERLVRSAVGVTAGTAIDFAEFVVPEAFRDSKSYEVTVRNSLGFLASGIGRVADSNAPAAPDAGCGAAATMTTAAGSPEAAEVAAPSGAGRMIAKKAAASFIDIAGLATLHVSPIWILAIVSDAAYGTQTYLKELAVELQKQGLIDDSSTIHRVDDLFDAVKRASGTAASSFDLPPLSLDELRTSLQQTRSALKDVDPMRLIPEAEIQRVWGEMKDVARREDVSLLGVSAAVAMQTVETIKDLSQGSLTGLFVAGQIVNRRIFGHYKTALADVRRQGIWRSVRNTYEPYVDLAWGNFTASRKTWTEQVLDPGHVTRAWNAFRGWVTGDKAPHQQ